MQNIIISKIDSLPEFMRSSDLVDLGLFPSEDALQGARKRGLSPDYIKHGRRVIYPKASVIEYIAKLMRKGDVPKSNQETII
jgi:hypothetical protein